MIPNRVSTPQRILWLVGLGTALSLPGDATLYVTLPTHTAEASIALASVGLMLSANRWVRVLLNTPYGHMLDRLPRRPVLVGSLFMGAFSTLTYTIPGFWPLLLGRVLWGLSWIGIWVGGNTVIMDIAAAAHRGRFSGKYQMWFFFGAGGSALLGGALTDWLGYRLGLLVSAGVTLAGAVSWLLFLPETRDRRLPSQAQGNPSPQVAPASARPNWRALFTASAVFGINRLVFAGVLGATFALLLERRVGEVNIVGLTIPLATLTGVLVAVRQALSMAASPPTGRLSDLRGERWSLVVVALILGATTMSWMGVAVGVALIVGSLVSAVAAGALQTLVNALIGDYSPVGRRGGAIGLLNTLGDLGSAIGSMAAYALLPTFGLVGVLGLCALLMALMIGWVGYVAVSIRAGAR